MEFYNLIDFREDGSTMSQSSYSLSQRCAPEAPNNFLQHQDTHDTHDKLDTLGSEQPNFGYYSNTSQYECTSNQYQISPRRVTFGGSASSGLNSSHDETPDFYGNNSGELWSMDAPCATEQDFVEIYNGFEVQVEPQAAEPWVEIIEQPARWAPKFRYMNERPTGRFPGTIPGINSTPTNKTYPTIRINNIQGPARVVVSCVTAEEPHRVHPHSLLAREDCQAGIYSVHLDENQLDLTTSSMTKEFKGLGIECAKRRDIEQSLRKRELNKVDPFLLGHEHKNNPASINLNVIRLCFQVFIEGSQLGVFDRPLAPCVTGTIRNIKIQSKLVICRLSHSAVEASGGTEIILLTEKIEPNDIQVRFYEQSGGQVVWESTVDITPANVHDRSALYFPAPVYRDGHVDEPVMAWMQLVRRYDGERSEPRRILFCRTDTHSNQHKKRKLAALLSPDEASRRTFQESQPRWQHQTLEEVQQPLANQMQEYVHCK